MSGENGVNPAAEEQISKWLDVVWRVDPGDYKQVENFRELPDEPGVRQDSIFWADKFFTGAASPYRPGSKVRRSIHGATPGTFDTVSVMCRNQARHSASSVSRFRFPLRSNSMAFTMPTISSLLTFIARAKAW